MGLCFRINPKGFSSTQSQGMCIPHTGLFLEQRPPHSPSPRGPLTYSYFFSSHVLSIKSSRNQIKPAQPTEKYSFKNVLFEQTKASS